MVVGWAAVRNLPDWPQRGKLPSTSSPKPLTRRAPSSSTSSSSAGCYRNLSRSTLPLCRPTPLAPFLSRPLAAHRHYLAFPPALLMHPFRERFSTPSVRSTSHSPPAYVSSPEPPVCSSWSRFSPPPRVPNSWCRSTVAPPICLPGARMRRELCLFLTLWTIDVLTCCCAQCVLHWLFWARCFLSVVLLTYLCPPRFGSHVERSVGSSQ